MIHDSIQSAETAINLHNRDTLSEASHLAIITIAEVMEWLIGRDLNDFMQTVERS